MRLWTLHPKYLDPQGLVALWREGLLARAVLRGMTVGYRHHPQLLRFRRSGRPRVAINAYLGAIAKEAGDRGYRFDRRKIGPMRPGMLLNTTDGQIAFEWQHLLRKLRKRSPRLYEKWRHESAPASHPLFQIVGGRMEDWERARPVTRGHRARG